MDTTKLIKRIFAEIQREVDTNDALRQRLAALLPGLESPPASPRKSNRRKPGAFDPLAVFRESPNDLKPRLEALGVEELKDIIAEQGMDRSKLAMKWKTKERLVDLILSQVKARVEKGDAFRDPDPEPANGGDTGSSRTTAISSEDEQHGRI